jgi:thiosulfate/3-mercaptopyruvate sulfurtransferase
MDKTCQILDARPAGRFSGREKEPRPGLSSGHMPNAINIPFAELVDPISKTLIPKEKLKNLFKTKGVDLDKPIITTCGSGVTASMIYFALDYLGITNIAVYDGSWTEYASMPSSIIVK